jgi:hypothetical protein
MDANAAVLNNKVDLGRQWHGDMEIFNAKTVFVVGISGSKMRARSAYLGTIQSKSHFLDLH